MAGVKRAVKSAATKTVKKEVIKTNKLETSEVKLGETPIEKTSIGLGDVIKKITKKFHFNTNLLNILFFFKKTLEIPCLKRYISCETLIC